MISPDRMYVLALEEVQEEYEKLYAECEELKKIKGKAIKAFQVLWAETHTKTAWSAHIFAQNMLLSFFGGQKAFNEAKKKRKELLNTVCFKGEALDLFVTELEQELKDYKKKYEDLRDKKECLMERYEEVLEVLKNKIQELDRYKQALTPFEDEFFKYLDTKTIAELAKKSFRLTRENRKLEDVLDEIEELTIKNLEKHYNHCKYAKGCVNPCGINSEVNLKQILDIIKKAKEEDNENT